MKENIYPFAIALDGEELDSHHKEYLKREYNLKNKDIKELKHGYLFRLSDFIQYQLYDADDVAYSEDSESYYHLGEFRPTSVDKEDVVALVDENSECFAI